MKRFLLLMLLTAGMTAFAVHAQEAPDALIKRVASDVMATLKADKDIQGGNKKKLYDLVDGKIAGNFNFMRMTALAMGRNWSKATPEQQKALAVQIHPVYGLGNCSVAAENGQALRPGHGG